MSSFYEIMPQVDMGHDASNYDINANGDYHNDCRGRENVATATATN